MRPISFAALIACCVAVLGAGCTSKGESPAAPPASAAGGGPAATTTRDPRFKNDPNVPDYIKRQAGGGGAARSGPAQ